MLSNELINIAERQINIEISRQNSRLTEEIAGIRNQLASKGMFGSSVHVLMVQRACAKTITERGKFIWEILFRCIKTIEIQYDENLEQQLKSFVDSHLQIENLNSYVVQAANEARVQNLASLPNEITQAKDAALGTVYGEIELFLMQLKHAPSKATPYSPSHIYIQNSNVGAIQTGSHSVANVSQQVDSNTIATLSSALEQIASALKSVSTLPNFDKSEISEIVDDGITELSKEKPNFSKVKSYICAIGEAVGFVADIKPAYESLKAGALMLGISLP